MEKSLTSAVLCILVAMLVMAGNVWAQSDDRSVSPSDVKSDTKAKPEADNPATGKKKLPAIADIEKLAAKKLQEVTDLTCEFHGRSSNETVVGKVVVLPPYHETTITKIMKKGADGEFELLRRMRSSVTDKTVHMEDLNKETGKRLGMKYDRREMEKLQAYAAKKKIDLKGMQRKPPSVIRFLDQYKGAANSIKTIAADGKTATIEVVLKEPEPAEEGQDAVVRHHLVVSLATGLLMSTTDFTKEGKAVSQMVYDWKFNTGLTRSAFDFKFSHKVDVIDAVDLVRSMIALEELKRQSASSTPAEGQGKK